MYIFFIITVFLLLILLCVAVQIIQEKLKIFQMQKKFSMDRINISLYIEMCYCQLCKMCDIYNWQIADVQMTVGLISADTV